MNKPIAIIPARFSSTRLPGKPLLFIGDQPMIFHVVTRVIESGLFERVIVATDDERILESVLAMGYEAMLTSKDHENGTLRIAEVVKQLNIQQAVVNIQGDEPFISIELLKKIVEGLQNQHSTIVTAAAPFHSLEELQQDSAVKVVFNEQGLAMYFSRSIIPFVRDGLWKEAIDNHLFWRHVGVYGFQAGIIDQLVSLPSSILERSESLEQLKWLEAGYSILVAQTEENQAPAVDTPEDLVKAEMYYRSISKKG